MTTGPEFRHDYFPNVFEFLYIFTSTEIRFHSKTFWSNFLTRSIDMHQNPNFWRKFLTTKINLTCLTTGPNVLDLTVVPCGPSVVV